ncbi:glycosyltransferase family 4 protein [Opitutales bacterium]|nr:glycosyltransferase family 4 protein [Opitutales bacterium]
MTSDKKLKIIHTEASPHWGGQEIRIFEEMKWFREQGHEMILVAPDDGTLFKRCKEDGFQVISVYFTKPRTLLNILKMLWILWRLKPDAVATHSSTDSWAGLIAAYTLRIKVRARYRHVSTTIRKSLLNRTQYRYLCSIVVTTGECISDHIRKTFLLDMTKVKTLPTAIYPPQNLPTKSNSRNSLIQEIGADQNSFMIGQISVLRSWKGHQSLIYAFEKVAQKYHNTILVLVGGGPIEKSINDLVAKSIFRERIYCLGHKENPWPYFSALDVVVLASTKNEGIPQVLLQAMYSETNVIGTSVGGIPEVITNRKNGILVKPNKPIELAGAIEFYLNEASQAKKMIKEGKVFVDLNFSKNILGEKLTKIYL